MTRYDLADFPDTGHWRRRVALANREPSSAYKTSRAEINLAEVDAILEADERCRAYLAQRRATPSGHGSAPTSELGAC